MSWVIHAILALVVTTAGLTAYVEDADAHKVGVYAWVAGDAIVVEGYFGGRTKAVDCAVWLLAADGSRLAEARTDVAGVARFALEGLPKLTGDVKVILEAGEGHRADYVLRSADLPGSVNAGRQTAETPPGSPTPTTDPHEKTPQGEEKEALRQAVAEELKPVLQKLATLERLMLKDQDKAPSVRDIVGGIGWILGLVGLSAYFLAGTRRRQH
ncbi:MAG: hypothetical protein AB1646_21525 [Thermodesulfobacteriota bacterium]